MAQNWFNKDGLFIQYGTDKAVPELAGDYLSYGANRLIEVYLDLSTLVTASANILSNTVFFPAPPSGQLFIEKAELVVETAAASSGSGTLKVGLIQQDRATVPSNYDHAIIASETTAHLTPAGTTISYFGGGAQSGTLIGSQPANATGPYYLTAQAGTAVFQSGLVRIRIFYHGIGTITQ
jgi:hypothetical protein